MGPQQASIVELAMRQGRPIPKRIAEAPELMRGLDLYYEAFWRLDTCRSVAMDLGPIPWTAVHAYGTEMRLSRRQRQDLHHHVTAMDLAYRKWVRERRPKEQ